MLLSPSTANKPFMKVLFFVGLIIVGFWVASFFPDLVLTLIISTLTAFILKPLVRFLEYHFGLRRGFAVGIVFILIGGLTVLILIETIPFLISRIRMMYDQLKQFPIEQKLTSAAEQLLVQIPFIDASSVGPKVHAIIQEMSQSAGETTSTAASYLVNLAIIPFITYFILAEGDSAVKKLIERIPNKYFEMSLNIMYKVSTQLVAYLRGLLIECSIVGGLSIIGFMIIGVPYAIIIGIVTGIANLIPYLGPIIGAGVAVLASLIQTGDFSLLVSIAIVTVTVQLIDEVILQPVCFGKSVNMHPVAIILILIIGHQLMGVAGMIISIPIATILRVSAVETYWGLKHYTITA